MAMADLVAAMPGDRSLLIVEDDKSFLQRLARAMEGRGFTVMTAESVADGLTQLETTSPAFAVVDMRLEDGNGLDVICALKRRRPDARAIILTGYGNIATAVNAVKLGAVDYLSKPVDADDVVAALLALEGRRAEPPENPMSADRVRWEHIQRIYELCGRNVSQTARRLNMHRRTLQRILAKRARRSKRPDREPTRSGAAFPFSALTLSASTRLRSNVSWWRPRAMYFEIL
jgi:two-component system, response regulator RegA